LCIERWEGILPLVEEEVEVKEEIEVEEVI